MKNSIGKPYEGKLHVRFDVGGADSLNLFVVSLDIMYELTIRLYSTRAFEETAE